MKFLKWLFKRNGSDIIVSQWMTEEESKIPESSPEYKNMYDVCKSRKQLDDNVRDLIWISIAIIVVGLLIYFYTH